MAKDGISPAELLKALKGGAISPVYLLHGEEDFLADEAEEAIVHTCLTETERHFNLDVLYGNESDARDVMARASSFPMGAERRVVVVRDVDRQQNRKLLAAYVEEPSPSSVLILQATKPDFREKPFVTLKKHATLVQCSPLREHDLPAWINRRLGLAGRTIEPAAAQLLNAISGRSLRAMQNELDKLAIYAGERTTITADDVSAVVGVSREFNVFELQNAIGEGKSRRALDILDRMMTAGESAIMIVVMLTRFYMVLMKLRGLQQKGTGGKESAREAGVNPWFLDQYLTALRRLPGGALEDAIDALAKADEELKSSSGDDSGIMQVLLVRLLGAGEPALPV